jgi:hypothetical protein
MLYDPNWKKPSIDDLSLADFIAWLETKNPNGKYDYLNCEGNCLMSQYMAARGVGIQGNYRIGDYVSACYQVLGWHSYESRTQSVLSMSPNTYGAALQRARELQKKQKKDASVRR